VYLQGGDCNSAAVMYSDDNGITLCVMGNLELLITYDRYV